MNLLTSNLLRASLGCAVVFFGAMPSFAQTNAPAAVERKTHSAAARDAAELPSLLVHSVGLSGLFVFTPPVRVVPDGRRGHYLDSDDDQ